MIEYIYSPTNPGLLLHLVVRPEWDDYRTELIEPDNFLQAALISAKSGTKFRAHRHIAKKVTFDETTAQESWVVLSGLVEASFFDLNDELVVKKELFQGDISITLAGGHSYRLMEDSKIIEFKSGPYLGQIHDKVFIDEEGR